VAGLSKRDLLKEVLNVFGRFMPFLLILSLLISLDLARSKTLAKLAQDWQDIVRKSMAEE
jgi:hypothetical protein